MLNEVVTVGYSTTKVIKEAHPAIGWDNFKHYLQDKANSADGKKGKVQLRFVVNADDSLSDFIIIKSLSPVADATAIRIVREGPAWVHNANGKPETITIKMTIKE